MKYLVTGCAGFIGWKVSQLLLERGDTIIGADNLNDYYSPVLKQWRLSQLMTNSGFKFYRQDISSWEAMRVLFSEHRFDAIINLAARAGVRASVTDPWIYYQTNVTGTLNLLECCKLFGVNKFILASSSSVYGLNDVPFKEADFTDRALSPYAASKKGAEVLCYSYHHLHGLNVMIPRFFTVYGPAGRPDMSYLKFIDAIARGLPIEVYGDGSQRRDFTYVDDIADGVVRALEPTGYEIFNLGGSQPVVLNEVISIIEDLLGKKAKIVYGPIHSADTIATWASNHRAQTLLGWSAKISMREGLRRAISWYQANPGLF